MEKPEDKYPEFSVPEGFTPPEGSDGGREFEGLGRFKIKENGNMCLVAVDGFPVTSVVATTDEEPIPGDQPSEFENALLAGMETADNGMII